MNSIINTKQYASYRDAMADGYRYEVHYAKDCDSSAERWYAMNLQAALFLANAFVRCVDSFCDSPVASYADIMTTDPKESATILEYVHDIGCFSDELTDNTFLHLFIGAEL